MNTVNFQASVSNLVQMDRHQQDTHRMPVVNQEQNATIAKDEAARRALMPVEADAVENKKVEAHEKNNERQQRKKKKHSAGVKTPEGKSPSSGYLLDVQV
jgi:hypothetical protein